MTTNDERRAQLARWIHAIPMDREAYLHEGRVMARPPVDELVDKIMALFADETPLLDRLWVSSTGLLDRFEAQPSVKQASDRMMSEVLELVIAAHDIYGSSTGDIAEEAADVVVTAINVLRAACVTQEQFTEALDAIIRKNDKKDHTTHRRSQQQGVERLETQS